MIGIPELISSHRVTIQPGKYSQIFHTKGNHVAIIKKKGFGLLINPEKGGSGNVLETITEVPPEDYPSFLVSCSKETKESPLEILILWFDI